MLLNSNGFYEKYSPIRIQDKSDVPHLSIARPLLELHTQLIEALARLLNVVDGDRDVSKPTPRVGVPVGVPLEVGV